MKKSKSMEMKFFDPHENFLEKYRNFKERTRRKRSRIEGMIHVSQLDRCPGFKISKMLRKGREESEISWDYVENQWKMMHGILLHRGMQFFYLNYGSDVKAWREEVFVRDLETNVGGSIDLLWTNPAPGYILPKFVLYDIKSGLTWKGKPTDPAHVLQVNMYRIILTRTYHQHGDSAWCYLLETKHGQKREEGRLKAVVFPPKFVKIQNQVIDIKLRARLFREALSALEGGDPLPRECMMPERNKKGQKTWVCRRKYCECVSCPHRYEK